MSDKDRQIAEEAKEQIERAVLETRLQQNAGNRTLTADQLTKQEKALATQALIFEQSADAAGAFARESDTLAGQQEICGSRYTGSTWPPS